MTYHQSHRRTRYGIGFLCVIASLVFAFSVGAQDSGSAEAPTEPSEPTLESVVATEAPLPTSFPSEAPSLTPLPTDTATDVPTLDLTNTPESSSVPPTLPPSLTPSETVSIPQVAAPLPLAYQTNFDKTYPFELSAKTGWLEVSVANGKALQASTGAVAIAYGSAVFIDAAVETRLLLNSGEGLVKHGLYAAGLKPDGTVSLYHNQTLLVSSTTFLTAGAWSLLRLEMRGPQIQVIVNGAVTLDYAETNAIPAGQVGFAASAGAVLRVDDFAVYGMPIQPDTLPTNGPTETVIPKNTSTQAATQSQALPGVLMPPVAREITLTETGRPLFAWEPVAGATGYVIEINDVCGDGSVTYQATTTNAESFQVPTSVVRLIQGNYTYCLKALGEGGAESAYSAALPFKVNYAYSYPDGSVYPPNLPIPLVYYSYNSGGNITHTIYIDDEPTFTAPYVSQSAPLSAYDGYFLYQALAINTPGTYYWRVVRSINGVTEPVQSLVYSTLSIGMVGATPTYNAPALNSTINTPTVLSWTPSSWQPEGVSITHYQVQISTSPMFTPPSLITANIALAAPQQYTFVPPANTNNVQYYWRVLGMNGTGQMTDGSTFRSVSVDNVGPNAPTITSPVADTISITPRPTIAWVPISGALHYTIQIVNATTQAVVVGPQQVGDHSYTLGFDLPTASYTAQVRATDSLGNAGAWASLNFSVNPNIPPTLTGLSPASNGIMNPAQGLTWTSLGAGYTYDVQLTGTNMPDLIEQATGLTQAQYTPTTTGPSTSNLYNWRVRAVDQNGVAGNWATSIISIPAAIPAPAIGQISSTRTGRPSFAWSSGFSNYRLEVNNVCGDGSTYYETQTVTSSHTIPSNIDRLPQGEYLFCVRAVNSYGHLGPFGSTPFKVAYNYTPVDHFNGTTTSVTLQYYGYATSGKTITYKIYVDDETSFTAPYIFESTPQTVTSDGDKSVSATISTPGIYYWRVVRLINGVPEAVTSPVYFTMIKGSVGSGPEQINPPTAIAINAPTLLSWYPSTTLPTMATITHYQVQISSSSNFYSPILGTVPVGDVQQFLFTPPANVNGATYYWRVYGLSNGAVVTFASGTRQFSVDTVAPAAPGTIVWPTSGTVTNQPRPTFSWASVSGANTYTVQIQNATTLADVVAPQSVSFNSFVPNVSLFNGSYIFRVRAVDGALNTSPWVSSSFTVQDAVPPPVAGMKPASAMPTNLVQPLSWDVMTGSGGPFTYDIEISTSSTFMTLVEKAEGLTQASYMPQTTLTEAGLYNWRVRSVNPLGIPGAWTTQSMGIDRLAPAMPTNLLSDPLMWKSGRPWFNWTPPSSPEPITFQVEINDVCGDGTPIHTGTSTTTSYSFPLTAAPLVQGEYVACVRAYDMADNFSGYTTPVSIAILYNNTPASESFTSDTTPDFTWASVPGIGSQVVTYKVLISADAAFTAPLVHESPIVSTASYTPAAPLALGRYYWRVVRLVNGVADPILTTKTFVMFIGYKSDSIPLINPVSSQVISGTSVTLKWADGTPPTNLTFTHYRLVLRQNTTTLVDTVLPTSTREYVFTLPLYQNNVEYRWQVIGLIDGIEVSSSLYISSFWINNIGLAAPTVTSPAASSTLMTARPTFTWNAVSGAIGYRLAIQNTSTATDVIAEHNTTGLTFTSPVDLPAGSYVFRIRTRDSQGNISVFGTRPFTIGVGVPPSTPTPTLDPGGPSAPLNLLPVTGGIMINAVGLSWSAPSEGGSLTYAIEISPQDTMTGPIVSVEGLTTPAYNPTTLAEGTYYWRVRAVNTGSVPGAWSAITEVSIDRTAPPPAYRTNGSPWDYPNGRGPFLWTLKGDAVQIYLELNNVCGDGTPAYSAGPLSGTSYSIPDTSGPMLQGVYQLCLKSFDAAGNASALTPNGNVWHLLDTSPTAGTFFSSGTVPLHFTSLPETAGMTYRYRIQIDDEKTFSEPLTHESGWIDTTLADNIYTTPTLPNGRYFWRVQRETNGVAEGFYTEYNTQPWRIFYVGTISTPTLQIAENAWVGRETVFGWTSANNPYATGYALQFTYWPNTNPNSPQPYIYVSSSSALSSTVPFPNGMSGSFLVTVAAVDMSAIEGGMLLSPWSVPVLVNLDLTPPNAPIINVPTANAVLYMRRPTFQWGSISDATRYSVSVQELTTMTDVMPEIFVTGLSYTPTTDLPNGPLLLRVRSYDGVNYSAYRTVAFSINPAVPIIPSPTPLTPVATNTLPAPQWPLAFSENFEGVYPSALSPATVWTLVDGTSGKMLQTTGVMSQTPVEYLPARFTEGAVEAHVQLTSGAFQFRWGGIVATFGTDGQTTSNTVTYNGTSVAQTTTSLQNTMVLVRLSVSANGAFQFTANGVTLASGSVGASIENAQVGFNAFPGANIRMDNLAIYGAPLAPTPTPSLTSTQTATFTATPTTTMTPIVLDAPVLVSPQNGATVLDSAPTLSWQPVNGATEYHIEIDDENTFTDPWTTTVTTTSHVPALQFGLNTYYWRVAASVSGVFSTWSTVNSFIFSVSATATTTMTPFDTVTPVPSNTPIVTPSTLPAPVLVWPQNGATQTDHVSDLVWESVTYAAEYRVEIDDENTFTDPWTATVTTTAYRPTVPFMPGPYYWRVAAVLGPVVSPWSAVNAFAYNVTRTATPTPGLTIQPPTLVAPAHNKTLPAPSLVLSWTAVEGAPEYVVQVDDVPSFSSPFTYRVSTTSLTPDPVLPAGGYYWRVAVADGAEFSDWSAVRQFALIPAATLIMPANNSLIITTGGVFDIVFKWSTTAILTSYMVQVDDDPAFTSLNQACGGEMMTCTAQGGMAEGTYFWRVLNNGVVASETWSFKVSRTAPRAVTLVSPTNARVLQPNERPAVALSWSWGTAAAPAGAPFTYDVEVSTANTFANLAASGTGLTETTFTTSDLADGTYFWHARAVNSTGLPGAWSSAFSFVVDSVAPAAAPMISAPIESAILTTARPTITWGAVPSATRYALEIGLSCGSTTPLYRIETLTTTTHTLPATASALPQGSYQACVIAYDASGNSITSAPRLFTVALALTPARGAFVAAGSKPTFTWAAAAGKTGETVRYHLSVFSVVPGQTTPVYESPALTTTSHVLPTALTQGNYAWHVTRSVNGIEDTATDRLFFVGALPVGPVITGPSTTALVNAPTPLTWDEGIMPNGVDDINYQIQISTSATFVTLVSDQTIAWDAPRSVTYTPLPNQNRVTTYWRVRGLWEGLPVTNWRSSTFMVDTAAPAAPTITAPAANALLNIVRPTITWAAVANAAQYRISIHDSTTNAEILPLTTVTTTSYMPTINLPQTTLLVRVAAFDGVNWGTPGALMMTVRLGTAPAQNAIVTNGRPTFTWAAVPGATSYTLQVSDSGDFATLLDETTVTGTSYTYPTAFTAKTIFWRVKASNLDFPANGGLRLFFSGTVKPVNLRMGIADVPTTKRLFNAVEAEQLSFFWDVLAPAPTYHEIQFSPTNTFVNPTTRLFQGGYVESTVFTEGVNYWRVRTVYAFDGLSYGPWSDVASFTVDRMAPTTPLFNPSTVTLNTNGRPTLAWVASAGATRYLLTVWDVGALQPVASLNERVVTGTSYTLPTTLPLLPQNNTYGYTWSVQAEDAAGNRSAPSLDRSLAVAAMLTPAKDVFLTDTTPAFTWAATTGIGVNTWTLMIGRTPEIEGSEVYTSAVLPATATSFTLPNALTPGLYYWRVVRTNETNILVHGLPFYVINTTASLTPTLLTPAINATLNGAAMANNPALTWSALTEQGNLLDGLAGYQVELAKTNTFTAASLVTKTIVTVTSFPLPALADGVYYWRVRAVFAPNNALGPLSAVYSLKVDQTAPSAPMLTAPVANMLLADSTPTFTWVAATGTPMKYVLQIDNNIGFDSLAYQATITAPTLTHTVPNASALPNGLYYWRVQAVDAAGNVSTVWTRTLTIAAP